MNIPLLPPVRLAPDIAASAVQLPSSAAHSPCRIARRRRAALRAGLALALSLAAQLSPATGAFAATSETPEEFHTSADVNGDGRRDIVIVDKVTGIYRIAYGQANGTNLWVDGRPSGVEQVTGFNVGRVLHANRDALAFTSPAANRINLFDGLSMAQAGSPVNVFLDSLGPSRVVALDIGGPGNTVLDDLYSPTIENNPSAPLRLTLTRSTGVAFTELLDTNLTAAIVTADAVKLKTNAANPVLLGAITGISGAHAFVAQSFTTGLPQDVAKANNLPPVDAFVCANFSGTALNQFLFYQRGASNLLVRPVQEPAPGSFNFGAGSGFAFPASLRQVITVPGTADVRLLIVFGAGETAGIYSFDGVNPPQPVESFTAEPGETFTGATATGSGHFTLMSGVDGKSTRFQDWKRTGNGYSKGAGGDLPPVNRMTSGANVFLFVNQPFVHPAPRLVGSLNAADWSSRLQTTNPPGQVSVLAEQFISTVQGLDNPTPRTLGASPMGVTHGLANQLAESYSLLSFSPAVGQEVVEVTISPKPGRYPLGTSITFSRPAGTNALILYRLSSSEPWKLYLNQPIPLYKDTTVSYYASAGGKNTTIRSAAYTFEKPPGQLDTDGDGVPDLVELGLGGGDAAVHSKDTDGDGYSDLAEILAGTNGPPGTVGAPFDGNVAPTNAPRADELSAFDWAVFPRAWTGIVPTTLHCETGTVVSAFDLHGGLLSTKAAAPIGAASVAYFPNLFADVSQRLYLAATEPHFAVRTNGVNYPPGADPRVGRELLRLLPIPAQSQPLVINYTYGNGTLEQETAAWIAAAQAAQAAVVHPVLAHELTHDDTLVALLWERKVGDLLRSRGFIAPTNAITLFPFRPQDAGRINPAHSNLLSLETNQLVASTGLPDPAFPAFKLVDLYQGISLAVTSSPSGSIERLRALAAEIYRISAVSNNVAPGRFPSPVDTLRAFLETGTLHSNYVAASTYTAQDLIAATTGVSAVFASISQRPTAEMLLRVRPDSFDHDCVILETSAGEFRSLILADGTAFKFPVAFELVPDSLVEVLAYTDTAPSCGVSSLEVIRLNVSAIPGVSAADVNGNLLSDAWECLYLVSNANGDNDQDGASNLKEFLDGTDPWNALSVGGHDDATPPVVSIEPANGGQLKFQWQWPVAYAARVNFSLVGTDDLGQSFNVENTTIQDLGEGRFQIVAPNTGAVSRFYRLQMSLK
jgi:hypothetical protein